MTELSKEEKLVKIKTALHIANQHSASPGCDTRSSVNVLHHQPLGSAAEAFVFADPPYVMSERSTGKIYQCELSDEDHQRFLGTVTLIDASKYSVMICGYSCDLYSPLDSWFSIDHRVPTRGGLQDERIWMNYRKPVYLHDYSYIGDGRRSRERIRRRQKNWREQLLKMPEQERLAMLEVLNSVKGN